MSQNVINEHTDENIKNYLSEEKTGDLGQSNNLDFGENKKRNIFRNKKAILAVVLLALVAVLSLFYFIRNKGKQSFDKTKVNVIIESSNNVSSGKEVIFDIKYENNTSVDLKKARISFFVPKEFIFISSDKKVKKEETVLTWNLGNIQAGKHSNIKLFGRIIGKLDEEYYFNSKISYIPENFNYEFESFDNLSEAKIKITSVPFELFVQSPQNVISGDEIEYTINYKNISDYNFKFVSIEAKLPEKFICDSFNINPNKKENNFLVWNIENLTSGAEGKFIIKGNIKTDINSEKKIKVSLSASENEKEMFEYTNQNAKIIVEKVPIVIKQLVNGLEKSSVIQGEELEYRIKFKNISEKEIKGLVVSSELEGKLDFDSLEVINGSYNKEDNKIIWSAFNVPKLAIFKPKEEEEVGFKIKVKDHIKINKADEKNFVIKNIVKISSFNFNSDSVNIEKTIVSNQNIVKLKASLFINAKGYYNDDGRIKNTGFIPPEVGKETNYLIHWNLSSLFNDINDIKIVSELPKGVNWTGNYIKSNGEISLGDQTNGLFIPEEKAEESWSVDENTSTSLKINDRSKNDQENEDDNKKENQIKEERFFYNAETREIIWEIPKLDANTGIVSPAKEVVFQIMIKPTESDIGKILKIMNDVKAIGYDKFIEKEIEAFDSELSTNLPDDYSIGIKEGIVIKGMDNTE